VGQIVIAGALGVSAWNAVGKRGMRRENVECGVECCGH